MLPVNCCVYYCDCAHYITELNLSFSLSEWISKLNYCFKNYNNLAKGGNGWDSKLLIQDIVWLYPSSDPTNPPPLSSKPAGKSASQDTFQHFRRGVSIKKDTWSPQAIVAASSNVNPWWGGILSAELSLPFCDGRRPAYSAVPKSGRMVSVV